MSVELVLFFTPKKGVVLLTTHTRKTKMSIYNVVIKTQTYQIERALVEVEAESADEAQTSALKYAKKNRPDMEWGIENKTQRPRLHVESVTNKTTGETVALAEAAPAAEAVVEATPEATPAS